MAIIKVIEIGTPGPTGAGITAPEKADIQNRLTAIEGVTADARLDALEAIGIDARLDDHDLLLPTTQRVMQVLVNPGAATVTAEGTAAPTLTATVTSSDLSSGPYLLHTSGAVSGNASGVVSAFTVCRRDWEPDFIAKIFPSGTTTNFRYWIGLFASSPDASSTPAIESAAFRYATDADTTNWKVRSSDGTGSSVTDTGVAFALSPIILRIRLTSTSALYYINNVLVATHTTNLPGASTGLGYAIRVTTLTASARLIRWGRIALLHE